MHAPLIRGLACALAALPLLIHAPASRAAVMVEIPLEELAKSADAIVRGQVIRTGTRVAVVNGVLEPRTHTWIQVNRWFRGAAASRVVEIVEPGGRYGASFAATVGTPEYRVGEEVVVFLSADRARPGVFRTHQMAQGKYRVAPAKGTGPRLVTRDLDEVAFASWTGGEFQVKQAAAPSMTLPDLLARIDRALADIDGRARPRSGK